MASENLKKIFLSAGVPLQDKIRGEEYIETVDLIAVRDAIRALATIVISRAQLIYGGQPAITRLVHQVMSTLKPDLNDHVLLYQSKYFEDFFPDENQAFVNKVFVESGGSREESLKLMRYQMIENHKYHAGIFIGGMKGVEDEFEMFCEFHPDAIKIPVASTGAAAGKIFERNTRLNFNSRLKNDFGYMTLFRELLNFN